MNRELKNIVKGNFILTLKIAYLLLLYAAMCLIMLLLSIKLTYLNQEVYAVLIVSFFIGGLIVTLINIFYHIKLNEYRKNLYLKIYNNRLNKFYEHIKNKEFNEAVRLFKLNEYLTRGDISIAYGLLMGTFIFNKVKDSNGKVYNSDEIFYDRK